MEKTLAYEARNVCSTHTRSTKFLTSKKMTKQKEYLVKFRFINTGSNSHEVVKFIPGEKRDPKDVINELWEGLLCNSGGLRDIISITELKD